MALFKSDDWQKYKQFVYNDIKAGKAIKVLNMEKVPNKVEQYDFISYEFIDDEDKGIFEKTKALKVLDGNNPKEKFFTIHGKDRGWTFIDKTKYSQSFNSTLYREVLTALCIQYEKNPINGMSFSEYIQSNKLKIPKTLSGGVTLKGMRIFATDDTEMISAEKSTAALFERYNNTLNIYSIHRGDDKFDLFKDVSREILKNMENKSNKTDMSIVGNLSSNTHVDKWNPADIIITTDRDVWKELFKNKKTKVKIAKEYNTLEEYNKKIQELYSSKKLIPISLKKTISKKSQKAMTKVINYKYENIDRRGLFNKYELNNIRVVGSRGESNIKKYFALSGGDLTSLSIAGTYDNKEIYIQFRTNQSERDAMPMFEISKIQNINTRGQHGKPSASVVEKIAKEYFKDVYYTSKDKNWYKLRVDNIVKELFNNTYGPAISLMFKTYTKIYNEFTNSNLNISKKQFKQGILDELNDPIYKNPIKSKDDKLNDAQFKVLFRKIRSTHFLSFLAASYRKDKSKNDFYSKNSSKFMTDLINSGMSMEAGSSVHLKIM